MKKLTFDPRLLLVGIGLCLVAGPASADEDFLTDEDLYDEEISEGAPVSDPFESFNRYTFRFNDFVYVNLVGPLADGYQAVTPDPVEDGADNFFYNLKYPVRLAANLLQGRVKGAAVETGRFVVNTGCSLGLATPADEIKMLESIPPEDMGQAFGSWGIGEGPYLVLPLLGPSNLRDLAGYIGDRAVNPLQQPFDLTDEDNWNWGWEPGFILGVTEFTVSSPSIMELYEQLKGPAIDPYSSIRNGYTQFRRAAVKE
ncbi:MAG: VacJ family lipoprotein [Verrucomicrobiota bacterium]